MIGSGGGFGVRPPQSETRTAGIPTDWKLVILQGLGLGIAGDVAILVVTVAVFVGRAVVHVRGYWAWAAVAWHWPALLADLWWLVPCFVVGWRFFVEIVDPSYPTPRASLPPEEQPEGPRMPWHKERWECVKEEQQAAERVLRVDVPDGHGNETRGFLPDIAGLSGFAKAASNGQGFTFRTAGRFKINREQFKKIRGQFLDRQWATEKDPDAPEQGVDLTSRGQAVLCILAEDDNAWHPSPTSGRV